MSACFVTIKSCPRETVHCCSCRHCIKTENLYIDHSSRFYLTWGILVIICATISSFEYANVAAFKYYWHERGGTGLWLWGWEILFSIDFFMKFFVDYPEPNLTGKEIVQRNHKKIAIHYYHTDFWSDFIPLIPFQMVFNGK